MQYYDAEDEYWEEQENARNSIEDYDYGDWYADAHSDPDWYEDIYVPTRWENIRADMRRLFWRLRHAVLYRVSRSYRERVDSIPF